MATSDELAAAVEGQTIAESSPRRQPGGPI